MLRRGPLVVAALLTLGCAQGGGPGRDAGRRDAGAPRADAGRDAGRGAGTDAGAPRDAGTDAAIDGGVDAGPVGGCEGFVDDLDDPSSAARWTPGNEPAGTQWGQFGHHWGYGTPPSGHGPGDDHGGGGALWAVELDRGYRYFESSYLESPTWDLARASSATLRFWHWLETEWCTESCGMGNPRPTALDGAQVVCWDGAAWRPAEPEGGYPATIRMWDSAIAPDHPLDGQPGFAFDPTVAPPAWTEVALTLPRACLRADARVRFRFGSDSGSVGNGAGWFVDDVTLDATCP